MMKNDMTISNIENVVMRRVRRMYILRVFLTPTVLSILFLLLAVWGIGREVWVARVFQNMPSPVHVDAFARFAEIAFLNTRFAVQVLVLAVVTAGIWFAYNLVRLLQQTMRYTVGG